MQIEVRLFRQDVHRRETRTLTVEGGELRPQRGRRTARLDVGGWKEGVCKEERKH